MLSVNCDICGRKINTKYRNKDYLVLSHYFSGNMNRAYICSSCLVDVKDFLEVLKKQKREEYYIKHPEYKYFNYLGTSRETGLRFFSLKNKLDKEDWDKISNYFYFCGYSAEDNKKDPPEGARGRWVTNKPKEVLSTLGWE